MKKRTYVLIIFLVFFILLIATIVSFVYYQIGRPPTVKAHSYLEIKLAGEIQDELDRFSSRMLDSGAIWDNADNSKLINKSKAAHQSLVTAIEDFDETIAKENFLDKKIGRRLLILCILVKYLEDRGVFPEKYFQKFHSNAECFFDILQNSKATIKLFEDLEYH